MFSKLRFAELKCARPLGPAMRRGCFKMLKPSDLLVVAVLASSLDKFMEDSDATKFCSKRSCKEQEAHTASASSSLDLGFQISSC